MKLLLHMICDYAPGDLAWAEIYSAVSKYLPEACAVNLMSVGSFETISTGFALAQIALAPENLRPEKLLVFANCAPRKDRRDARANNEGEGLLYALLNNGVETLVVNSGYSLSFVADEIKELWSVKVDDGGSQFRSRDNFPVAIGQLANQDMSFRWHQLDIKENVQAPPSDCIGYIDSFGNLKTTIRDGDPKLAALKPGQRIKVTIGCIIRTATVASGSFNVMEGDLAFAPGSSGRNRRYWEFFQRGGSATAEFGRPPVGTKITIETA